MRLSISAEQFVFGGRGQPQLILFLIFFLIVFFQIEELLVSLSIKNMKISLDVKEDLHFSDSVHSPYAATSRFILSSFFLRRGDLH